MLLTRLLHQSEAVRGAVSRTAMPMSRIDVADYLGLTIEAMYRRFSALKRAGTSNPQLA
jgi:CRP-like cAMP-binding protein